MFAKLSKQVIQYGVLGVLLVVNIFIWSATVRADHSGTLTVAFLDVGQGDAIYIESPCGNQMLIDGGPPNGRVLRELGRMMPFWDRSLDVVLATHPDQDHVGGLPGVLARYDVPFVMTTENTSDTGAYGAFEEAIRKENTERVLARAGERIIFGGGVVLEILFPDRNAAGWETNTASIVARLSYGDESFLFTGDSPQAIEEYLVRGNSKKLSTTVLKLGHHGSRTSSAREFLSAVDPKYAVVSAGKDNKYGHPHREVIDILAEMNIPVLSTMSEGAVIFRTDGHTLEIK